MDTAAPLAHREAAAHAAVMAVVVAWAGSFAAIKTLLDQGLPAGDIALLRYLVAAPGFGVLLWRAGGLPGLTRRDAARLVAAGLLIVAGYHLSLNVGTRSTTSGTAALVVALAPALTLLFAAALGLDRLGLGRVLALGLAFGGVAVVVTLGSGRELSLENAQGPLVVLGAPLSFALYNVLLKPLLGRYRLLALTAASSLAGTVALLPLARASTVQAAGSLSAGDAALVLYLGLACTLAGYAAWNVGLRALGPTRAVTYAYAISPLAVVIGALLLDEPVTAWLAVGGAVVVAGVALAQRTRELRVSRSARPVPARAGRPVAAPCRGSGSGR